MRRWTPTASFKWNSSSLRRTFSACGRISCVWMLVGREGVFPEQAICLDVCLTHTHTRTLTRERLCVLGLSTSRPSVLSLHSLAVADQETRAGTTRTLVSAAIRSEMLCLVCIFTCLCSVNSSDVLVRLMASSMCL